VQRALLLANSTKGYRYSPLGYVDSSLGEKGEATKKSPAPWLVALAQVFIKKSVIRRLARTNLSFPDRDRARAESLME
jgi:hypothetical protein